MGVAWGKSCQDHVGATGGSFLLASLGPSQIPDYQLAELWHVERVRGFRWHFAGQMNESIHESVEG